MSQNRYSYTAADNVPVKLFANDVCSTIISQKRIPPIHVQLMPTNKCNLNCPFCSCSERNSTLELPEWAMPEIVHGMKMAGCKAVTITGGGEPLMYPRLYELVEACYVSGIEVGLVTNGLLLSSVEGGFLSMVRWCRISNADNRKMTAVYEDALHFVVRDHPYTDWAFSHVVSDKPNIEEIARIVRFADDHCFTHVRLVADLFHPTDIDFTEIRRWFGSNPRVIIQERKVPRPGGPCYICYLKPVIGPDCKVYACCGVQYALDPPTKDMPKELCLGSAFDLPKILDRSGTPFDGSKCVRCYYSDYNNALGAMLGKIEHKEFV